MASALGLGLLTAFFQLTTVVVPIVTIPADTRIDIPLSPAAGEVEARRGLNRTTLDVRLDTIDPLTVFGNTMRAYVVWAVSPEGEFQNLGELEVDGRKAELDTATSFQRFGLLVTAEPYFSVSAPSSAVALTSAAPRNGQARVDTRSIQVGQHDYSTATLPPQGSLSSHVIQARMAFRIAQLEGADQLADAEFRQARVASDSMEELLRRGMDAEVLEAYISDTIRLAARAIEAGREQQVQMRIDSLERRAETAERENERLEQEIARLEARQQAAEDRLQQSQADLQAALAESRQLSLSGDELERQLRDAQAAVERLSDPWPPIEAALVAAGARQTARGIQVTLSSDRFESGGAELAQGTRELLARLVGIVTFGEVVPQIRIEGHMSDSGPASRSLTLSEERAEAVGNYLFDAGVPEGRIIAQGFGTSRPIPGIEDRGDAAHERVEIVISEP